MASSSKSSSANRAGPMVSKEEELGPNRLQVNKREQSPYPYPYPYPNKNVKVWELVPNRLRVENYFEWKRQMDDVITSNGMRGFIDGTIQAPSEMMISSDSTNSGGRGTIPKEMKTKEYEAWKKSDDLVRKWILNRLTESVKEEVWQLETAKGIWDALLQVVEDTKKRLSHYLPLYKAAIKGDWETADKIIQEDQGAVRARITLDSETALIVAVKVKRRIKFVQKLVDKMSLEDLALVDHGGRNALHRAAGAGNIKGAEVLVEKNPNLISKETRYQQTPLFYAAARGDREMILWLMKKMENKRLEGDPGFRILYQLTRSRLYDIARSVLKYNPELAYFIPEKEEDLKFHALTALAEHPSSFESGNNFNFLQDLIYFSLSP